jgi:hypothetical protein
VTERIISDDELRQAWHSPAPAFLIASELGIDPKNLQKRWRVLKKRRLIPWKRQRRVMKTHGYSNVETAMPEESNRAELVKTSEEFVRLLQSERRYVDLNKPLTELPSSDVRLLNGK